MARGNFVDFVTVKKRFGYYIVTAEFDTQNFESYNKIYFSRNGTLIGQWGGNIRGVPYSYKDYIIRGIPQPAKLIRRTSKRLFFKCLR